MNTKSATKLAIGLVLIGSQLFRENFGFISFGGSEAAGYNFFAVAMYAVGVVLIFIAIKNRKP